MKITFWILALLGALGMSVVRAESGGDPTRPALMEPAAGSSPIAAPSGLQSILRRPGKPSAAIINGQYVELGGRVGDARLERINESEVVLRGASGREVLRLTPVVEKTTPAIPQSQHRGPARRGGATK